MKCIGKQPTLEEIRSEKNRLYNEFKNKKNTREYEMLFLRYIPKQKKNGSQLDIKGEIEESEETDNTGEKDNTEESVDKKKISEKKYSRKNKTKKNEKNVFLQLFNKKNKKGIHNKTKKSYRNKKRKEYLY